MVLIHLARRQMQKHTIYLYGSTYKGWQKQYEDFRDRKNNSNDDLEASNGFKADQGNEIYRKELGTVLSLRFMESSNEKLWGNLQNL